MWQQVRNWIGFSSAAPTATTAASRSTTTNRPPTPSSDLYDLVLDMNWERVIQHCRDHPHDAHFQEGDTLETPLYLACQWSPPLTVMQALIDANPSALHTTSREYRDLPLHVICRYPTTTVKLLQAFVTPCPDTAGRSTKYGKTPLHIVWELARPHCMKQERAPQTPDEHEQVQVFWSKIQVLVNAVATSRQQQHSASLPPPPSTTTTTTQTMSTTLYQLHAVVSLGALACPYPVLEYVCHHYPDQLAQRDESGQLPLHLAVGPTPWSSNGKRKYKPREQAIIQLLLERYPPAARRRLILTSKWQQEIETETEPCRRRKIMKLDGNHNRNNHGRYPLHIAVANRHCWDGGVKDLFQAAPEILSVRDPLTRLYPFQLAAIPVRNNLRVDLTTIFKLLQQQPDLVTRTGQEHSTTSTMAPTGDTSEPSIYL